MPSIDTLITDASNRAGDTSALATAYLNGSMSQLQQMFAYPGITGASGVRDPNPPGPFVPATPPTLVEVALDTTGAPGMAPASDPLPYVMEGLQPAPVFTAPPAHDAAAPSPSGTGGLH